MPLQILGSDPFGVTVRKDDGSTVTIPHGIAQQMFADNSGFMGDPGAHAGPTFPMKGGYTVQPFQMSDGTMGDVNPAEVDQGRIDATGAITPPTSPQQIPQAPDAGVPAQDAPMNDGGQPPTPPPSTIAQAQEADAGTLARTNPQVDTVSQPTGQTPGMRPQVSQAPPPPPAPKIARGGGGGMPNVEQMLLQNSSTAADAATQAGDIKAQQIERSAPLLLQAQRQYMAATAQNEVEFKTRMAQADARSKALSAEVQQISQTRVNDNQFFDNMSTGGKIATFAALAMGGFVGAKTGTNMAADQIKNMVDNNIKVQLANLQNRREGVAQQNTLIQQDVARGMDLYTAATKAQALGYEQAAKIVELEGSKLSGQLEKANAAQIAAKLRQEGLQTLATYDASLKSTAAQNYATSSANMREKMQLAANTALQIAGQQVGYSEHIQSIAAKKEEEAAKLQGAQQKDARERTVISPITGSPIGAADDKEGADKARAMGEQFVPVLNAAGAYRDALLKYGPRYGGPGKGPERQALENAHAVLFAAMRDWSKSGANLSESEIDNIIKPLTPDPQGVFGVTDPLPAIDNTIDAMTQLYNKKIKVYVPRAQPIAPPSFNDMGGERGKALRTRYQQMRTGLPPGYPPGLLDPWRQQGGQ